MSFAARTLYGATLIFWAFGITQAAQAADQEAPPVVSDGDQVSIEYTLKLADGTVADSNVGGEPLAYKQGSSQILPALESQLLGMKVGESKLVSLTATEGYGEVDTSLYQTVPTSAVPEGAREAGTQLMAQSQQGGEPRPVRVHEVKGEEIVMDLNHPLAGQALEFDVKVLSIE